MDIDGGGLVVGFGLTESASSSELVGGVGGKYSNLGESKLRAEEAIEFIHARRGWGGDGSPKLSCSYMRERVRGEIFPDFLVHISR